MPDEAMIGEYHPPGTHGVGEGSILAQPDAPGAVRLFVVYVIRFQSYEIRKGPMSTVLPVGTTGPAAGNGH